jgi:hypothetical protein
MTVTQHIKRELTEATAHLWHSTGGSVEIIKTNTFQLTFSGGTQADNRSDKYHFYLSCSRIPDGGYTHGDSKTGVQVNLELDGQKLAQNYRIDPIKYWGDWTVKASEPESRRRYDENEDRIWSRKPTIPDARKYIVTAHVYLPPVREDYMWNQEQKKNVPKLSHDYTSGPQHPRIFSIFEMAQTSGVPFLFYNNFKAYKLADRRRAIEIDFSKISLDDKDEYKPFYSSEESDDREVERVVGDEVYGLKPMIDWLENPASPESKRMYWKRYCYGDFWRSAECDVHNARQTKLPKTQEQLGRLSRLMRKRGVSSIKDLVLKAQETAYQWYRAQKAR